jgi:hypothetical protein
MSHCVSDARGFNPFPDFHPTGISFIEQTGNLVERDAFAIKHVCDFRNRAR